METAAAILQMAENSFLFKNLSKVYRNIVLSLRTYCNRTLELALLETFPVCSADTDAAIFRQRIKNQRYAESTESLGRRAGNNSKTL